VAEIDAVLRAAGFDAVRVVPNEASRAVIRAWAPGGEIAESLASASIEGVKPGP
jgi:hypothetical protein